MSKITYSTFERTEDIEVMIARTQRNTAEDGKMIEDSVTKHS